MPVLQEINESYGYIPRGMLEHLACRWGLRLAGDPARGKLLRPLSPRARRAATWSRSARGRRCHSRGSRALLKRLEKELGVASGQTDKSGRFTLRTVRCLGPVRLVAGHEDRRPELRPGRPRPDP